MPSHMPSRVPRARLDPIRGDGDALAVLTICLSESMASETIAVVLDHACRGISIVRVSGTSDADAVVEIADFCARTAEERPEIGAFILASVRPGLAVGPDDVDRWLDASARCAEIGTVLLEWYVFADGRIECPRDLLGEPPRWIR